MKGLEKTWLFEGLMDFEYKQYILLAYLQKVGKEFDDFKLYPAFSDLLKHYDFLQKLGKGNIEPNKLMNRLIKEEGGSELTLDLIFDKEKLTPLVYDIIQYSLDEIKDFVKRGKLIYDEVEACLEFEELTSNPTTHNGYLLVSDGTELQLYSYEYSKFNKKNGRALKTKLIDKPSSDIDLDKFVEELVDKHDDHDPSVFIVESIFKYPIDETILPVAKRFLLKKLIQRHISH